MPICIINIISYQELLLMLTKKKQSLIGRFDGFPNRAIRANSVANELYTPRTY